MLRKHVDSANSIALAVRAIRCYQQLARRVNAWPAAVAGLGANCKERLDS